MRLESMLFLKHLSRKVKPKLVLAFSVGKIDIAVGVFEKIQL